MPHFVEGQWLFKREGLCYLAYAVIAAAEYDWERIYCATAPSGTGPWTFGGNIMGIA